MWECEHKEAHQKVFSTLKKLQVEAFSSVVAAFRADLYRETNEEHPAEIISESRKNILNLLASEFDLTEAFCISEIKRATADPQLKNLVDATKLSRACRRVPGSCNLSPLKKPASSQPLQQKAPNKSPGRKNPLPESCGSSSPKRPKLEIQSPKKTASHKTHHTNTKVSVPKITIQPATPQNT
eukprot:Sdes_comp20949_c0_seq1m18574